jgi:hypothetical protein
LSQATAFKNSLNTTGQTAHPCDRHPPHLPRPCCGPACWGFSPRPRRRRKPRARFRRTGLAGLPGAEGRPAGQLACFQQWADAQTPANTPAPSLTTAPANPATGQPATPVLLLPSLNTEAPDGKPIGCKNTKYSELSRFWELQRGTDCDTFSLRGYRPISLAVVTSDSVNTQPSSPSLGHTALTSQPYMRTENKIQLSVRTKIAKGLLKNGPDDEDDHDSVWFGYTQQSYWQLFNGHLAAVSAPPTTNPKSSTSTRTRSRCRRLDLPALGPGAGAPVQRPVAAAVAQLEPRLPDGRGGKNRWARTRA